MNPSSFTKQSITADAAGAALRGAMAKATELGLPVVVVVVDESGTTKSMARMDGAPLVSVQVAADKAYTAAATGLATDQFYAVHQQDASFGFGLIGVERVCPIGGGLPIVQSGTIIGAIGVSGGTVENDMSVAAAGLAAVDI